MMMMLVREREEGRDEWQRQQPKAGPRRQRAAYSACACTVLGVLGGEGVRAVYNTGLRKEDEDGEAHRRGGLSERGWH